MTTATPPQRRLPARTMAAYGVGTVAYGVKDSGFGTFLLLFYNQVLGVPAATVGFVIMLALLLDALIDPAIGFLSDRTRSRWGRRHPWMYAAALPIAIGYYALWSPPPGLGQGATLAWLFGWAVIVRTAVSCYEVPSVALTPELSSDYDERTRIMAWRYLFGWVGGLAMMLSAYLYLLAPAPAAASRADYAAFGLVSAILMATAILVSALGTHREIPNLPASGPVTGTLAGAFRELIETLRNRAYAVLLLGGLCAFTLQGIGYALANYFYAYVWHLAGVDLVLLILGLLLGAFGAFAVAPRVARRGSKAPWVMGFGAAAGLIHSGPYWLRVAGLFPDVGTAAMFWTYFGFNVVGTTCSVAVLILAGSMMADVVEESEARTGRRSEGVFFAGYFFVQKSTSGLGIFAAGAVLTLIGFPVGADPKSVDPAVIDRLSLAFAGLYVTIAALGVLAYSRFPFGRAEHDARLARLAARR